MALPLQLWQGTKQHSRVCSNDNGTSFERCNIPLPNTDFFLYKGQRITARSYLLVEFHTVNMYFKSSKIYLKQQVAGGLFISERKSYLCPWPEAGTFTCPYCLDSFIRYSSKKKSLVLCYKNFSNIIFYHYYNTYRSFCNICNFWRLGSLDNYRVFS